MPDSTFLLSQFSGFGSTSTTSRNAATINSSTIWSPRALPTCLTSPSEGSRRSSRQRSTRLRRPFGRRRSRSRWRGSCSALPTFFSFPAHRRSATSAKISRQRHWNFQRRRSANSTGSRSPSATQPNGGQHARQTHRLPSCVRPPTSRGRPYPFVAASAWIEVSGLAIWAFDLWRSMGRRPQAAPSCVSVPLTLTARVADIAEAYPENHSRPS